MPWYNVDVIPSFLLTRKRHPTFARAGSSLISEVCRCFPGGTRLCGEVAYSILIESVMRSLRLSLPARFPQAIFHPGALISFFALQFAFCGVMFSQRQLPQFDVSRDSTYSGLDFSEVYLTQQIWENQLPKKQLASGIDPETGSDEVSVLDLAAPRKAVEKFNQGIVRLEAQKSKEAIGYLEKAILIYPKFLSAHKALGFAYFNEKDPRAREEFETVTKLDDNSANAFLDLGVVALHSSDFATADANLEKAAQLRPNDPRILETLAMAETGDHKYMQAIETSHRLHALGDRGMAIVHYISALAAQSLHNDGLVRTELNSLLSEDPSNPMAPAARKVLEAAISKPSAIGASNPSVSPLPSAGSRMRTFPNTARLKSELSSTASGDESTSNLCDACGSQNVAVLNLQKHLPSDYNVTSGFINQVFTIKEPVDETVLFLTVTRHGHSVDNLPISSFRIEDGEKPPAAILDFVPQQQMRLHLGVLIDTSDSINDRMGFEKEAAKAFIKRVMTQPDDRGFVAGFNTTLNVTEDFTSDSSRLASSIDGLKMGGDGTSVFDAIYVACWKLQAYPDDDRAAKVLVVLSDGQDNSSRRSLEQALEEAEAAGVMIFTIDTSPAGSERTEADRVMQVIGERTGGESTSPTSSRQLMKYVEQLAAVIRNGYLITYKPSEFVPDGRYRSIHVEAFSDGKGARVHVRKGYYARLAPAKH